MLFSIIYSVDVPSDVSLNPYRPPHQRKLWWITEENECYDYDYLGGRWRHGKHRKYCAMLTQEQFDEFIGHVCIYAEDVETMGSIGAPGFGFGLAPAISFSDYCREDAILNAYVTPIPGHLEGDEIVPDEGVELPLGDEAWQRIRQEIIEQYS